MTIISNFLWTYSHPDNRGPIVKFLVGEPQLGHTYTSYHTITIIKV